MLSQNAAKYAIIDLGQAAESWGEYRQKTKTGQCPGRRVGFLRFKRRKHEQGFRADNGPDTVWVDGREVILPKIGRVVDGGGTAVCRLHPGGDHQPDGGNVVRLLLRGGRARSRRRRRNGPTVGVDVGVGTMAVCSDGTKIGEPEGSGLVHCKQLRRVDQGHRPQSECSRQEQPFEPAVSELYAKTAPASTHGWSTCGTTIITSPRRR